MKNSVPVVDRCVSAVTKCFDVVFSKDRLEELSFEICEAVLDTASQMDLISLSYRLDVRLLQLSSHFIHP